MPSVEAGISFINERGRMLYVNEGGRTLLIEGGRTLFVDLRVGQCGGKEQK